MTIADLRHTNDEYRNTAERHNRCIYGPYVGRVAAFSTNFGKNNSIASSIRIYSCNSRPERLRLRLMAGRDARVPTEFV